ncbi:MAG: hypothetical protein M3146_07355 [Thermoproteota archaeon]|nr:hypothetical protein [Thermoproteota archaeon]
MNVGISALVIVLSAISLAVTPILIINQSADAQAQTTRDKHWCRNQTDKSADWIFGCQNGWWDHNHCQNYMPESGHYARGYVIGWEIGHCR